MPAPGEAHRRFWRAFWLAMSPARAARLELSPSFEVSVAFGYAKAAARARELQRLTTDASQNEPAFPVDDGFDD